MRSLLVALVAIVALLCVGCAGMNGANGGLGEYAGVDVSLGYDHNFGNNDFNAFGSDLGDFYPEDTIKTEIKVLFRSPAFLD